ncbi:MAG: 3-isopropylmalate dehydratase small subunit [Deltaproteobacteria bacterium]|nr:3-isopropylmalate dehydratase small subunit [Deltaproteobacteria bacterium]MBN2671734.1 3-isopropylmalate dehydratase small subunit [Deltaproteobacteria bacterium]
MKSFGGKVLFLNRSDINTDEIIPAKYLTEVKKEALGPHMLEDLKLDGFDPQSDRTAAASVIVTRQNFGCGSSREHAPWALEVNGITVVIAENYARIFRQNMFNCGMLAIELDAAAIDSLFSLADADVKCAVDIDKKELTFTSPAGNQTISFSVAPFDEALVRAGGWVEYADNNL